MKITELRVPRMGYSVGFITIVKLLKKEGENVAKDESVLEFKASFGNAAIPSPVSGRILKQFFKEGDNANVNELLTTILRSKYSTT